jgi:hypothetical protein
VTGEDGRVDGSLKIILLLLALLVDTPCALAEEDHGASRASQRLVGSGGDNVGVGEGRGDDACCDETRDVGHVREKVGANVVGNLAHALVLNQPAVCRRAGDNNLGAVEVCQLLHLLVVNEAGLLIESVRQGLKILGDGGDLLGRGLVPVRQMPAMGEVQGEDAVVNVEDGRVGVEVGGRAGES